jgi:hypothetical protein
MRKHGQIRIGVGTRLVERDKPVFFIEVILPISAGSEINLDELEEKLKILKNLKEEGFQLVLQDDSSFSCELITEEEDIEKEYEKIIVILSKKECEK